MIRLKVNGRAIEVDAEPDTPLLWALRDHAGLTGTKYGCGKAPCGACMVHLGGNPTLSCVTPVAMAAGREITTIEGIGQTPVGRPLEQAWVAEEVPQCGYCQSGQIMSAAALLVVNKAPSDADIDAAMSINLCRCGTYQRIRGAIRRAAQALAGARKS
ncbi:MAG: (2Fe-2S)-binding protein [Betaproteobacteria bacterium]|nr:(2Fe-2S)-binding protein [Betaproteobacteria bacterium]